MKEGYVTIAIGSKYMDMAKCLEVTLKKYDPKRKLYIITEKDLDKNKIFYKSCTTTFERFGSFPKIWMHEMTPFKKSIFLDADVLCASNPNHVWNIFKDRGKYIDSLGAYKRNYHFKNKFYEKFGKKLYLSHGGLIYIDKQKFDPSFMRTVKEIWYNIDEYLCGAGLSYHNSRDDQLIHSIAKSLHGNKPLPLVKNRVMTFVGKGDTIHPRYKPSWYACNKWYDVDRTWPKPFPFYHMFNKKFADEYNSMFHKIIDK